MTDLKDLKKLVSFLRKQGISRYKSADIELELSEGSVKRPSNGKKIVTSSEEKPPSYPSWESLSPEQQLLWSATQLPIETDA